MHSKIENNFKNCTYENSLKINRVCDKQLEVLLQYLRESFSIRDISWWQISPTGFHTLSTYPDLWLQEYAKNQYKNIDVVISKVHKTKLKPFIWGKEQKGFLTRSQRDFLHHASEYGLRSGISFCTKISPYKISSISFSADMSLNSLKRCHDFQGIDLLLLGYFFSMMGEAYFSEDSCAYKTFSYSQAMVYILEQYRQKREGLINSALSILDIGLQEMKDSTPARHWLSFQVYISESLNYLQNLLR